MVLLWWQSIDSCRFIDHKEMIQKAGVTINAKWFDPFHKAQFCIGCPVPLYCISSKGPSSFLPAHNKRQRGKGSANLRAHCLANFPLTHCRFTALVAPYNFSLLGNCTPLSSWSNFIEEGITDHTHFSCTVFYVRSFRSKIFKTRYTINSVNCSLLFSNSWISDYSRYFRIPTFCKLHWFFKRLWLGQWSWFLTF